VTRVLWGQFPPMFLLHAWSRHGLLSVVLAGPSCPPYRVCFVVLLPLRDSFVFILVFDNTPFDFFSQSRVLRVHLYDFCRWIGDVLRRQLDPSSCNFLFNPCHSAFPCLARRQLLKPAKGSPLFCWNPSPQDPFGPLQICLSLAKQKTLFPSLFKSPTPPPRLRHLPHHCI